MKKIPLLIHLDMDMKAALEKKAKKKRISLGEFVRKCLEPKLKLDSDKVCKCKDA